MKAAIVVAILAVSATVIAGSVDNIDHTRFFSYSRTPDGTVVALSNEPCGIPHFQDQAPNKASVWRTAMSADTEFPACWGRWPDTSNMLNVCDHWGCMPVLKEGFTSTTPEPMGMEWGIP